MKIHILTLFPDMVMSGLSASVVGRAIGQGIISVEAVHIRDFSEDPHRRVDDTTYGGGAGMLLKAQPVYDAWRAVCGKQKKRTIYVTPQGRPFTQRMAEELAGEEELVILCGHYEGVDERVLEEAVTDPVSIGDYVLTGGELAAMVIVDAVVRLIPGVLHNELSAEMESFHGSLLEYPQYTRPEVWHGKRIPEVLLTGNRRNIEAWRLEQAILRTQERRPDLYQEYCRLQDCRRLLLRKKLLHMDMIELINRGRAELVWRSGDELLLRDVRSGICFHSRMEDGPAVMAEALSGRIAEDPGGFESIVFHQEAAARQLARQLSMHITAECRQVVWTRREKLPVRGLYRPDQRPMEHGPTEGLVIQPLEERYAAEAARQYDHFVDEDYIRRRIEKGAMAGAFVDGQFAGFIGFHEEGSIGMLEVYPAFRRRHIAKALETYQCNQALELGYIPYGQVIVGNEKSLLLQVSLGMSVAKESLFWSERDGEEAPGTGFTENVEQD